MYVEFDKCDWQNIVNIVKELNEYVFFDAEFSPRWYLFDPTDPVASTESTKEETTVEAAKNETVNASEEESATAAPEAQATSEALPVTTAAASTTSAATKDSAAVTTAKTDNNAVNTGGDNSFALVGVLSAIAALGVIYTVNRRKAK